MKTFLLVFALSIISHGSYSQKKTVADSISTSKSTRKEVKIRCIASINSNESPLYIIDGVPMSSKENFLADVNPDDIVSIDIIKDVDNPFLCYGSAARNGVVLITTKGNEKQIVKPKKYVFKTYKVCNDNWNTIQDIYNAVQAEVPGISITSNSGLNQVPNIRMRGDDNTIVIVDGIRYDASILSALNPSDIESVTVAPSIAASNYLINN